MCIIFNLISKSESTGKNCVNFCDLFHTININEYFFLTDDEKIQRALFKFLFQLYGFPLKES